jgi:hypothetical protein
MEPEYYAFKYMESGYDEPIFFIANKNGRITTEFTTHSLEGLVMKAQCLGLSEKDLRQKIPKKVLSLVRSQYLAPPEYITPAWS